MNNFLESPLKEQVDTLEEKGFQFYLAGNSEAYGNALLDAWKLLPEPKESWDRSFSIASRILQNHIAMGNPAEAKKWIETVLKQPERYGEGELYAGMVAYELEDFEMAKVYFDIVQRDSGGRLWKRSSVKKYFDFYKSHANIKTRPKSLSALIKTAKEEIKNKNFSEALDLLYDALNLNQMKTDVHFNKGLCHFELGEFDHAADSFTRAYMLDGETIFNKHDAKYFEFLKTKIEIHPK